MFFLKIVIFGIIGLVVCLAVWFGWVFLLAGVVEIVNYFGFDSREIIVCRCVNEQTLLIGLILSRRMY